MSLLNPKEEMSEIDLSDDKSGSEEDSEDEPETKEESQATVPTVGLSAATIVNAVLSIDQFRQSFEVS